MPEPFAPTVHVMRNIEVIDSELRLLAAVRHTARELTGRTPSTVLIDQLLEERAATLRPDQHNTDALNSNLMTVGN